MREQAKRLLHLGTGELAAGLVLAFLFSTLGNRWSLGLASACGLVFLVFLLMQGGMYWLIRYKDLKRKKSPGKKTVQVFAGLRNINLLLAATVWIGIIGFFENSADLIFGILLYLFAVIEYINYYEFRLSYGASGFNLFELRNQGLKRSSLHRLIRNKKRKRRRSR